MSQYFTSVITGKTPYFLHKYNISPFWLLLYMLPLWIRCNYSCKKWNYLHTLCCCFLCRRNSWLVDMNERGVTPKCTHACLHEGILTCWNLQISSAYMFLKRHQVFCHIQPDLAGSPFMVTSFRLNHSPTAGYTQMVRSCASHLLCNSPWNAHLFCSFSESYEKVVQLAQWGKG
jgi:hypothetical protein